MRHYIRNTLYSTFRWPGKLLFRLLVKDRQFTVFSNDCYGVEIYQTLNIEYNTPFVGLMLMAPCYIKFLKQPQYYLNLPLVFIQNSAYTDSNTFRRDEYRYPIAILNDIEIHFLHYKSEEEATEKWNRRKKRINWQNLRIKFAIDKDYAERHHLTEYIQLPYEHKVCFSKENYSDAPVNIRIVNYKIDGTAMFKESLKQFDICNWLNGNGILYRSTVRRLFGKMLYFFLSK